MANEYDDDSADFMSEVSSVMNKAETSNSPIDAMLTNDDDDDIQTNTTTPDQQKLLDLVDTPEEKRERKTLSVKKPAQSDASSSTEEEEESTEQQTDDKNKTKFNVPYIDRFLKQDKQGNLVLSDGSIVATKGKVRDHYEGLKREGRHFREAADKLALSNAELAKNLQQLNTLYKAEKANSGYDRIIKETSMTRSELDDGIRIMKLYKQDPVNAIKSLLTQARINGIDLSSIGVNGGIDPATLAQAIARAKDYSEPTQEVDPDEQLRQEITQEVDDFFTRNEEALPFIDTIAEAKQKYPDASLDQIWYQFKIWQRQQAAAQSEKDFNTAPPRQPVPPQQRQQQPVKRVLNNNGNFGAMSIDEIASALKKDLTNG